MLACIDGGVIVRLKPVAAVDVYLGARLAPALGFGLEVDDLAADLFALMGGDGKVVVGGLHLL